MQRQQHLHSRLLARGRLAVGKALATLGSTMLLNRAQYVDRVGSRLSVTNQGAGLVPCELPLPVTECTERRRSQSRGDSAGNQGELHGCGESFCSGDPDKCPTCLSTPMFLSMLLSSQGVAQDCRIAGYVI